MAYPIIKRLLIHTSIVTKPTKLFYHHEILRLRDLQNTGNMAFPLCVECSPTVGARVEEVLALLHGLEYFAIVVAVEPVFLASFLIAQ